MNPANLSQIPAFDEAGDLWIPVSTQNIPPAAETYLTSFATCFYIGLGTAIAGRMLNLTKYLREQVPTGYELPDPPQ